MRDQRLVEFGHTVRELRKSRGLSQEGFADLAGIDRSYMGHIERGERNVTLIKVFLIAEALNVPVHQLLLPLDQMDSEQLS